MEKSLEISKSDLLAHFDALALSMQKLKKHLSDSASFLPEFGIKTAQTVPHHSKTKNPLI